MCASLSPRFACAHALLIPVVVGASRRAQSTVDGFHVIHTKLTDSVECSPRQAGAAAVSVSRADRQTDRPTDQAGGGGAKNNRQDG